MSESYGALVANLRQVFQTGKTLDYRWRIEQLRALLALVEDNSAAFQEAIYSDLGKPREDTWTTEISVLQTEIKLASKKLRQWMKPRSVSTPLVSWPSRGLTLSQPLGVVLIIGPWNFPLQLLVAPLIGAIAAGNCAIIKPSELAPATSALIAQLTKKYLDNECIIAVEGGVSEATRLLDERFNHIFFTGGTAVGRVIMRAASNYLTPVTLELGGKSPAIVDAGADIPIAARRIVWGKFLNAGQVCIAPDYILVHQRVEEELLKFMKLEIEKMFSTDASQSDDYGRIVDQRHWQRLMQLLKGSDIYYGGKSNADDKYLSPTILKNVSVEDAVMKEEIFGPILPVVRINSLDEAITYINKHEKPLALYLFSKSNAHYQRVMHETSSGGVCVNDTIMHFMIPGLPFGGVGQSGQGSYHGWKSFDTFSHQKSILKRYNFLDIWLRYPPYTDSKFKWLKMLMKIGS